MSIESFIISTAIKIFDTKSHNNQSLKDVYNNCQKWESLTWIRGTQVF